MDSRGSIAYYCDRTRTILVTADPVLLMELVVHVTIVLLVDKWHNKTAIQIFHCEILETECMPILQ